MYGELNFEKIISEYTGRINSDITITVDPVTHVISGSLTGPFKDSLAYEYEGFIKPDMAPLSSVQQESLYNVIGLDAKLTKDVLLKNPVGEQTTSKTLIAPEFRTEGDIVTDWIKSFAGKGTNTQGKLSIGQARLRFNDRYIPVFTNAEPLEINQPLINLGNDIVATRRLTPYMIDMSGYTPTQPNDIMTKGGAEALLTDIPVRIVQTRGEFNLSLKSPWQRYLIVDEMNA